ncbi:hypothetical protein, partial [Alicyclobacillus macrosporangiidus]|uniref:hypothetical protein n=1 Tax=Alicyclobacillus macrosporangiidus TaxID=392015 RepID=UPI001C31DDB2
LGLMLDHDHPPVNNYDYIFIIMLCPKGAWGFWGIERDLLGSFNPLLTPCQPAPSGRCQSEDCF